MAEKKYTTDAMLKAMEAVSKGTSVSSAARQFKVPRTILIDKINGRSAVNSTKGPATVLTKKEEEYLEKWLIFMADSGFPVTKEQLQDSVCILMKKLNRKNPFPNDKPGRHWFEAFVKRHPLVGERVAQNLTQSRALVKEADIRTWFKEIEEYFIAEGLKEVSEDPRRIFNCDESAFFLSPSPNRVLAKRGSKNVYNVIPSGEKECVTVLITANAAGELAPPMVLYKLKSIPHKISSQTPDDWGLGHTAKGWMTGELFYEYVTNVFYPWIVRSGIPLPDILFLDGHCSHTTLPLSNFCREKKIILIALYPNATHLLQPMDVSVFRPLKRIWKKVVYDWRNENKFTKLKKDNFCPLLEKALKEIDRNTIANGFRKTGLSPFNADNVDYSKCVTNKSLQIEKEHNASRELPDKYGHFKFFESQISPTKLELIRKNKGSIWLGDKSLEGLFNVWKQIKNQLNTTTNTAHTPSVLCTDVAMPMSGSSKEVNSQKDSTTASFQESTTILPSQCSQIIEPVVTNDDHMDTEVSKIGNFTGLSNILDSSYYLNDISELCCTDDGRENQEQNYGNIEMFEVMNGELTKIAPNSIFTSSIDDDIPIVLETRKTTKIGQTIHTTGSEPLYLIPRVQNKDQAVHFSDSTRLNELSPKEVQEVSKLFHGDLVVPTPFKDALFWPESPPCPDTKQKIKIPSVITSDRWQIFAQKKNDDKIEKERKKTEPKIRKKPATKKTTVGRTNILTNKANKKDWYCRLCETCTQIDMIQCLKCEVWYHTSCAEVY